MTDVSLVHPELREALNSFPPMNLNDEALAQIRAITAAMPSPVLSPGVRCDERRIKASGDAPDVRILVYQPVEAASVPRAGVLAIHGGGYIFGTPDMDGALHSSFAAELGCVVVAVNYRLAPDTVFPGALEDCYTALKWLHEHAGSLGIDPKRIGVSGMSAGGGLAAALSLYVRDKGESLVAFQHLIYPMIDDRSGVRPPNPHVGQFVWTRESNRFGWRALLGTEPGGAEVSPYAAAARAEDLSGLPPTYLAVGAIDLFLQEDLEFVNRLSQAGVPVEAHVYPGVYHGFHRVQAAHIVHVADRDSRDALARFCGSRLGSAHPETASSNQA